MMRWVVRFLTVAGLWAALGGALADDYMLAAIGIATLIAVGIFVSTFDRWNDSRLRANREGET